MNNLFRTFKLLFLTILLNILIITSALFLVQIVFRYLGISTEDYPLTYIFIFYAIIGMGGAFISLAFSRIIAKKIFKIKIIESSTASNREIKLLNKISVLAQKARLPKTPEFGIFESAEVNAFATGPSRSRSLVAISSALLNQMDDEEIEGVLAHEMAHIANGDMVTMTVLQGIVNTMVLFLARILTSVVSAQLKRRNFWVEYMIFTAFHIVLNLLGSILVLNVFSRYREYQADKGAARLAGISPIVKALKKLQSLSTPGMPFDTKTAQFNAFKIASPHKKPSLIRRLLSTHPPLELRIRRVKKLSSIAFHLK